MLSQSLNWRKKYQVDKILSEYETVEVIKDYFPGGWHHTDKGSGTSFNHAIRELHKFFGVNKL